MTTFLDLPQTKGADWLAGWVTLLTRLTAVTNALEGMAVTSSSSVEPDTGELSFVTDQTATDRPLAAGATVRGKSAADPTKFFVGTVTSFSGTALVVEATLAGGAGAVTDWVIGYELAQALTDLTADLDANGFSISALLNLAMTGNATVGGTLGVTGAATLARLLVTTGDEWAVVPLGSVTTTQTIGPTTASVATVTLGGDVNLDHAAPTAGYEYSKKWRITQDGTGGRVPTFRASDGTAATWPNDDEPDWGAQDPAAETRVVAVVEGASTVRMFLGG